MPRDESISARIMNAESFPKRITLELSAVCNLRCAMCPRQYISNGHGLMEMDLFEIILNQIKGRDIEAVVPFFRGESLLHHDFIRMLRGIRESVPAAIQLATNALRMDHGMISNLMEIGIDFISFSMDAIYPETYERIRRGSDFHQVMKNVHAFLDAREKSNGCNTMVQISATETEWNADEIPAFIEYWQKYADRVRIYPLHSEAGHFGRLSNRLRSRKNLTRQPCKKPFTDLVIYYDGQTALCNHDWDRSEADAIGCITKTAIEEIWNNEAYRQIRQRHLNRSWSDLDLCRHCDHWVGMHEQDSGVGTLVR